MSNSIKVYKITCTNANTAYNVVTGTPTAPTTVTTYTDKGTAITFQCQTNGALGKAGGSDVVSNGGIQFLGPDGDFTPPVGLSNSAYQAADWWVSADTAGAIILVLLVKKV